MMILSLARSKSSISTRRLFLRAANRAASFTRLARSAPDMPGVPRAMMSALTSGAIGTLRMCTSRICSRPRMSGSGTTTWRSKRPGRSSAGSRTSGRLVAAMTITPVVPSNPSISTSSWLSVCSRSSLPPPRPAPRWRPTASISSMNTMHGACFFAWSNMSRTRAAPTPTNISTKSEPEIEKNGTFASPAIARASSVFPVPGLPTISTPFGMRPPSFWNLAGSRRKSTSSATSSFASSQPATSAKVMVLFDSSIILARDFPNENAPPPALHLAHEEDPHADQEQHREPGDEDVHEERGFLLGLRLDLDAVLEQVGDEPDVARRVAGDALAVVGGRLQHPALDQHLGDSPGLHLLDELRILHRRLGDLARIELVEHRHQHQADDQPDHHVLEKIIQRLSFALNDCVSIILCLSGHGD